MTTTTFPTCEATCSKPATHDLDGFHFCAAHYDEIAALNASLRDHDDY